MLEFVFVGDTMQEYSIQCEEKESKTESLPESQRSHKDTDDVQQLFLGDGVIGILVLQPGC